MWEVRDGDSAIRLFGSVHMLPPDLQWRTPALEDAIARSALDAEGLRRHVECVVDQCALREALASRGLVAFLAEGAILPRASGVDDRPLSGGLRLEVRDALGRAA